MYKNILIKKYEAYSSEEALIKKKLLSFEILNLLMEVEKPDSEDFYIWGLTYYKSDDDKTYYLDKALDKFKESYRLDSRNFMACLYIGHCLHDKAEFDTALRYYELVNQKELKEFQLWRFVKLKEQIGFCYYKLGNHKKARHLFEEVLEWHRKLPMEDRPTTLEMLQCLPESDEIIVQIKEIENYL